MASEAEKPQEFDTFQDSIYSSLLAQTRTSGNLVAGDINFAKTIDDEFKASLEGCNKDILKLTENLLKAAAVGTDSKAPKLENAEDLEDGWRDIVGVIDYLLERAGTCLDEYTGAMKRRQVAPADEARAAQKQEFKPRANNFRNQKLDKPQLQFRTRVNNLDDSPFRPLITSKPHAVIPLEDSIRSTLDDDLQTQYTHPYQVEIERSEYPASLFQKAEPIPPQPYEGTEAIYVDNEESLMEMLEELKKAKEIAVDLEHHDLRSFVGIVCLMQISTREKDWIVDTLKLREELQVLNEVFADPKIIKVLHGAFMDIIWLQRDLGLYMVNLFDTFHAANALGFPTRSLAFLLKKYVNFDAAKQFQTADWRIRPLPKEMFDYARSDTHFLLYIFDNLRNELIEKQAMPNVEMSAIEYVLKESRMTALKRYTKEVYNEKTGKGPSGWETFIKKNFVHLNLRQLEVFKALHAWRDRTARTEDESHHFIMPKHVLLSLARGMPEEPQHVIGAWGHKPPQIVRLQIADIVNLIKTAKVSVTDEDLAKAPGTKYVPAVTTIIDPSVSKQLFEQTASATSDIFSVLGKRSNLRSESTTFWGPALGSSKWESDKENQPSKRLKFDVPLPKLNDSVFVVEAGPNISISSAPVLEKKEITSTEDFISFDDTKPSTTSTTTETTAIEGTEEKKEIYHEYTKTRPAPIAKNDVIVVKEVGGSRKRKHTRFDAIEAALAEQETDHIKATESVHDMDMVSLFDGAEPSNLDVNASLNTTTRSHQKSKKQRRAERKEREEAGQAEEKKEFEPFDYSKADSVLHKKGDYKEDKKKKREAKSGKKEKFDPFAKHGDAPKGLRKRQTEFEGRSATFKK